jgi:hypothetical protein
MLRNFNAGSFDFCAMSVLQLARKAAHTGNFLAITTYRFGQA